MTGFVLVDKPTGWTSHDVVAKLRGIARTRKVGHCGTLDPMATGLLVLGVGAATRLLRFAQSLRKEYTATALFGVATDSLDADGEVVDRHPLPVTMCQLDRVLDRFRGEITQTPPMFSAVKVGGRRLYEMAREGKTIERQARPITIYELEVTDVTPGDYPEVTLRVVCSSGTYVRTLADDLARAVGGRAHLTSLRRHRIGEMHLGRARTIDQLQELSDAGEFAAAVMGPVEALGDLPAVHVDDSQAIAVRNGSQLAMSMLELVPGSSGHVRVIGPSGRLLSVGRIDGERIAPEVVLPQ